MLKEAKQFGNSMFDFTKLIFLLPKNALYGFDHKVI